MSTEGVSWASLARKGKEKEEAAKASASASSSASRSGSRSGGASGAPSTSSAVGKRSGKGATRGDRLKMCQDCVGYHVELQVKSSPAAKPQKVQGIVYAAHDTMLVLQESSGLRLINIMAIASRPVILPEKDGSKGKQKIVDLEVVSAVDETTTKALEDKFNDAKARRQEMLANRNADASAWAQQIFDKLQKTFKCTWDGTTICINNLGNLRIADPYTVDAISGSSDRAVDRVKTIIQQMMDARDINY